MNGYVLVDYSTGNQVTDEVFETKKLALNGSIEYQQYKNKTKEIYNNLIIIGKMINGIVTLEY